MNNTRELLAAVKRRHRLTSDYQLAKFLNISKQRISGYQAGTVTLGDLAAIKVADALEMDRGRVLAIIAAERAQSEQAKREWLKLAATVAAVAVVVLFAPDAALLPVASDGGAGGAALCIMSSAAALALAVRFFLTRSVGNSRQTAA